MFQVIEGNLAEDPAVQTPDDSGRSVARMRVAVSDRVKKGESWGDGPTTFVTVWVRGTVADNVADSLHSGDRVVVSGEAITSENTGSDGNTYRNVNLNADTVGASLRFHTVTTSKPNRS